MASANAGKPLLQDFESSDIDHYPESNSGVFSRGLESTNDKFDFVDVKPSKSVLQRFLMAVRRQRNGTPKEEEYGIERQNIDRRKRAQLGKPRWRRFGVKSALCIPLAVVFFFGIVHLVNVGMALLNIMRDDEDPFPSSWAPLQQLREGQEPDLNGLTRDITPIPCHSHNDYWRQVPLYDALRWGCTGVEADVWLFNNELFVGHNTNALTQNRTFRSMYVDPLVRILDYQNSINEDFVTSSNAPKNGVYEVNPSQTLVLLVDFKNDGHDIYPFVSGQIEPFRKKGYLTYFNGTTVVPGPITIVATGNAPFDSITANTTYRDIFFDAPLDRLYEEPLDNPTAIDPNRKNLQPPTAPALTSTRDSGQGTVGTSPTSHFDLTNSYYASVDLKKAIGWIWFGRLSTHQLQLIKGQVQGAKRRGLKSRYWGTPNWPVGLRNKVWKVLVEEGVDYLNGDDLKAMTKLDWSVRKHWGWLG